MIILGIMVVLVIAIIYFYRLERVCIKDKNGKLLTQNAKDSLKYVLKYPYGEYEYEIFKKKIYENAWHMYKTKKIEYTKEKYEIYAKSELKKEGDEAYEFSKAIIFNKENNEKVKQLNKTFPKYKDIIDLPYGNYEAKIYLKNPYNHVEEFSDKLSFTHTKVTKAEYLSNEEKENIEKRIVNSIENSPYKLIKDVALPNKSGKSRMSKIDYLLIHKTGIYIIMKKDLVGEIYCNGISKNWINLSENKKLRFINPLKKIKEYELALRKVLNNNDDRIIESFVVFNNKAVLKNVPEDLEKISIITEKELEKNLKKSMNSKITYFSESDIMQIYNIIEKYISIKKHL